jgi:hypothetical protein
LSALSSQANLGGRFAAGEYPGVSVSPRGRWA